MYLQLPIVKGQKRSGKCIWYIGQQLEDLSSLHLFKSQQCHYSSEGNCCTPQILMLPNNKVCTDILDNRAKIFDDAFEDLMKQGNQPATAVNDVRN